MMLRTLSLAVLLLAANALRGQEDRGVPKDLIEQFIEAAVEELGDDDDVDLTTLFDVLSDRYTDPIDLNRTTIQELSSLVILSDLQIGALFSHLRRNGKLLTFYELQTIDAFDARTLALIRPFVTVRDQPRGTSASLKEIIKNSENEFIVRSVLNLEQRRGFMNQRNPFGARYTFPNGSPLPDFDDPQVVDSLRANNRVYLGSPYKLYTRYRFRYRQNISFGFTAEKDEGEEFFRGSQPQGFDFYSAHLFLRDMGRVKALALGDYQAQFGLGLTFWSGLAFASKSAFSLNVKRNAAGLVPYTSVNENLFLRGAGATVEVLKGLDLTLFYSSKGLDANVNTAVDTSGAETDVPGLQFSSFIEDGFHRTNRELERRRAVRERIAGGHIRWRKGGFSAGVTGARVEYGATLERNTQPYNQFEFNGRENTTVGADFSWLFRNTSLFGEVARSASGGLGINLGGLVALDRRVSLAVLYRNYERNFHGLYSVGFAEGGRPWNERGLYTGIEIRPNRRWSINAYFDQFRFPWLRYQVDAPSDGYEALGQVNWRPSRGTELYFRARIEEKGFNTREDVTGIDPVVRRRQVNYRFNAVYKVSPSTSLRTRLETVDFRRGEEAVEHGFLLYQDLVHRPLRSMFEFTARIALFQTDSYDARLYAYESDLIGLFSIPPYSGRGTRWYAMVRMTPLRRVDLWVRYGAWIFQDRTTNSSGLQEINAPRRSDIKVQVRVRF